MSLRLYLKYHWCDQSLIICKSMTVWKTLNLIKQIWNSHKMFLASHSLQHHINLWKHHGDAGCFCSEPQTVIIHKAILIVQCFSVTNGDKTVFLEGALFLTSNSICLMSSSIKPSITWIHKLSYPFDLNGLTPTYWIVKARQKYTTLVLQTSKLDMNIVYPKIHVQLEYI